MAIFLPPLRPFYPAVSYIPGAVLCTPRQRSTRVMSLSHDHAAFVLLYVLIVAVHLVLAAT